MALLRRTLAPIAAMWLCCQIGSIVSVPVALSLTAADHHATECTCGHGPGATCPMHHKPSGDSAPCAMQAAQTSDAAILTTLVSITGLAGESTRSIQPATPSVYTQAADVHRAGERPVPPDPPPPRG